MRAMMERPSLGQLADLGDLYNARTDQLCGVSIFKERPRLNHTQSLVQSTMDTTYTIENPTSSSIFTKKCRQNLVTCPQHQLNILTGLTPVNGSGEYLMENCKSLKSCRANLHISVGSKMERINFQSGELFYIDPTIIEQSGATHMVFQMKYGANMNIMAEPKDDHEIDGKQLEKILDSLTLTNLSVREQVDMSKETEHVTLNIYGDSGRSENMSWELAWVVVNNLRNSKNAPSWRPTIFYLVPLNILGQLLKLPAPFNLFPNAQLVMEYKPDVELKFLPLFDKILKVKQRLFDLDQEFVKDGKFLARNKIQKLLDNLEMEETKLKIELQWRLPVIRQCTEFWTGSDLTAVIQEYKKSCGSAGKIAKYLKSTEFLELQKILGGHDLQFDFDDEREDETEHVQVDVEGLQVKVEGSSEEKKDEVKEEELETLKGQQENSVPEEDDSPGENSDYEEFQSIEEDKCVKEEELITKQDDNLKKKGEEPESTGENSKSFALMSSTLNFLGEEFGLTAFEVI